METIKAIAITERRVTWTPKPWGWASRTTAIVRDGEIKEPLLLDGYYVNKDIDGAIEFLQAIKRAMAETKK